MTAASRDFLKNRVASLREQIRYHDQKYYVDASPEISDREYDRLMDELKKLESTHPDLVTVDSPTRRVGDAPVPHLEQVQHLVPMLSIENTYSPGELSAYFTRTERLIEDTKPIQWVREFKIDGVAAAIIYEQGVLTRALTRGNGDIGDDITHTVRTIRDIPLRLLTKNPPPYLEVRGEVYMTNSDLADLNLRQTGAGLEPYKNTRNVTAGTIRTLDAKVAAERNLRFFCHGVGFTEGLQVTNHLQFLEYIKTLGIPPTPGVKHYKTSADALAGLETGEEEIGELGFEVDGLVFKVNDFQQREALGTRSKSPRWMIAYKVERYEAVTLLENIDVQVGKTGTITPVAFLSPVEIAETTVSRATLHNKDEIERLDVRVGDWVVVEKAGKIIPKVTRVEKHRRTKPLEPYKFPSRCPQCDGPLEQDPGGVYIRCINPSCPAQLRQRLHFFASRTGMDIDSLGEKILDQLVDRGIVKNYHDLYRLTADDFMRHVDLVKEKKANKLVDAIAASKDRGMASVLTAIAIRHVGPRVAKVLASTYPDIETLSQQTAEQLSEVHEIGPTIAASVHQFLGSETGRDTIRGLREAGVRMDSHLYPGEKTFITDGDGPLAGKTLVVTGTLQRYTREQIKEAIENAGGRASSSVSKSTDYLVAGEKAGSKLDKAKNLGVTVLSEDDFQALLGG